MPDQEILPVHLVVHLPILQEVIYYCFSRTTQLKMGSCSVMSNLLVNFLFSPDLCVPSVLKR